MFGILALVAATSSTELLDRDVQECATKVAASEVAYSLNAIPAEVRRDIVERVAAQGSAVFNRDTPPLQTDAPTSSDSSSSSASVRFAQAYHVGERWFVQVDIAGFTGVNTFGYDRRPNGLFAPTPGRHFGGPPCASIEAALAGVISLGGI